MKMKKYKGPSMPVVMQEIRKDLGKDAIILNTKEIKSKGFLGLMRKKQIEVVAALDPEPITQSDNSSKTSQQSQHKMTQALDHNETVIDATEQSIHKELLELKKMIHLQNRQHTVNEYPMPFNLFYQDLLEQDVEEDIATKLIEQVMENVGKECEATEQISIELKKAIQILIQDINLGGISYHHKFVHIVGPTGVGKTTTIAKIAAKSMLNDDKRVAFITTDTYRIAAIDQLKTYAKILDIPIEVAYTLADYERALNKFSDYDLVLVDTAGRNYRESQYVKDLQELIQLEGDSSEIVLVLSLTAKSKDLKDIYHQFRALPIKNLIFTKMDETSTYGSLLNIPLLNHIGISYITMGQDVPDDLIEPSAKQISELLVSEN